MRIGYLSEKDYRRNFWAFIWHAAFFAVSKSFIDTDTVISSLIIKSGGNEILLGLMTTIMIGGANFLQLFFASFISHVIQKKKHLLIAINLRILFVLILAILLMKYSVMDNKIFFAIFFAVIFAFTFAGSYGGIAYTDLLGKSIKKESRLKLFSVRQLMQAFGFVISAFLVKIVLKKYSFPDNYFHLFLYAAFILFIGSLGFWLLREKIIIPKKRKSIIEFFKLIPYEIKKNKNLLYYILIVNLIGILIVFSPFLVSFFKIYHKLTGNIVGNFLIIKMIGAVLGSVLVLWRNIKYKIILNLAAILAAIFPILALITVKNIVLYLFVFFIGGIIMSFIRIATGGILIEISNDKNRAEYAGIVGAANISGLIFPLFIGSFLRALGYIPVFITISLISISMLFLIGKLDCK